MGVLKATILLEYDGQPIKGFDPFVSRLSVDELRLMKAFPKANDGDTTTFTVLPILASLNTIQAFAILPQGEVTERHDGQADKGTTIKTAGLLLGLNVEIDTAVLLSLNNNSGTSVAVDGFAAGT